MRNASITSLFAATACLLSGCPSAAPMLLPTGDAGEDFTIILVPDTQFYSESFPETFDIQMQWIIDQRGARNIVAVLHLGDIVDEADKLEQWRAADRSIAILETEPNLPLGLAVGNHDQFPQRDPGGTQNFNAFFPVERFESAPWYGGHFGDDNDNHFILFSGGGIDFVAIMLEFDADANADVLAWAEDVIEAHADRTVIVVTHFALTGHALRNKFSDQGRAIRDALFDHPNVDFFFGGHFCETGRRRDTRNGNEVISILADYQCRPNGGDGWLRILEFSPANNRIDSSTYSPTRGDFFEGPRHAFSQDYSMHSDNAFELIARGTLDVGATTTVATWSDLVPNTTYKWFAATPLNASTPLPMFSRIGTFTTSPAGVGE